MDDRAVRPRTRDAVEAQILEQPALAPQRLQLVRRGQFVERAARRLAIDPVQEPRHRHCVTRLCRTLPRLLGVVLDRARQHRRIAHRDHFRTGFLQRFEDRRDRTLGIDRHSLPGIS